MVDPPADATKFRKEVESLTEQLLRAFDELDLLHSVCDIFSSSTDPAQTQAAILSEAMATLEAEVGWIVSAEPHAGDSPMLRGDVPAPTVGFINEKVVQEVVRTGRHLWTDTLDQDLAGGVPNLPKAFLCVPLKAQQEVLGAICLGRSSNKVFTAGDLKVVQILCAPSANAILQQRIERAGELKRYLSPRVAETILRRGDIHLRDKRAELTMFVCELKGFAEAAEEMEPEELIQILNEYLTSMTAVIFKYEGTLDKFLFGSIFGFFGDPIAQEDHPVRAVQMAIEMQQTFAARQSEWRGAGYPGFGLGISVATGYVTVGNVGSPNRSDYTAIGKNVILAARLADLAERGQILVGQRTYGRIKDLVDARSLGTREIGKQPVRLYEVEYAGRVAAASPAAGERDSHAVLQSDRRISHYRILEKLGEGGMGQVYKAEDTKLGRTVALKVVPQGVTDDSVKRRFLREGKALSALNHPHIATIYEIDEQDSLTFIAMEYIEGKTLMDFLKSRVLTVREALDFAIPIAEALMKAHEKLIVHRDIKPSNIMVTSDGYVKVLDFGLAKLKASPMTVEETGKTGASGALTEIGTIWGTVSYMSPEQAAGLEVDHRSDIFSFAIVLYEMLAGRRPFSGGNRMAVLQAILGEQVVPLSRFNPEAGGEVERIVGKALEKDPDDRYQGVKDMLVDLKKARRTHSTSASGSARLHEQP